MTGYAHLLHQTWHQLRFLPVSPLAQLIAPGELASLDRVLARAGVFRPQPPALRDLDRLGQLRAYLALAGRGPVSRFCDGSFRALYAGESLATCEAEMSFHHGRTLADSGEPAGAIRVFEALSLKVSGAFPDLRKGHAALHRSGDYGPAQALGRTFKGGGEPGLIYRAVRRPGGECLALFAAEPVKAASLKQVLTLTWDGFRLA